MQGFLGVPLTSADRIKERRKVTISYVISHVISLCILYIIMFIAQDIVCFVVEK